MATPDLAQISASSASTDNPNKSEYNLNEKVLCFHGSLIYEARILKTHFLKEPSTVTGEAGWHCFVHYKGWKRTWDEWVPTTRVLKHNELGLTKQEGLLRQHPPATGRSSGLTETKSTKTTGASKADAAASITGVTARLGSMRKDARGAKRSRDEDDETRKPEMKLNVPEALKLKLVRDWEWVTKEQRTIPLPRQPNVETILNNFRDHILQTKPTYLREPETLISAVIEGIQCYFDRSLSSNLLYRVERKQFADIRKLYYTGQNVIYGVTEREMSAIYGAEHLLRMIVCLPGMVSQSALDSESVLIVRDYVNELLQYMWMERRALFVEQYPLPGSPM